MKNIPTDPKRVLELLVEGKTAQATADQTGWPRTSVLAAIKGQRGWLLNTETDKVCAPGNRNGKPVINEPKAAEPLTTAHPDVTADTVTVLSVRAIEPHPGNIRGELGELDEMAASIRQHGILQPLVVQRHPGSPGRYRMLTGHRRLAAAQIAGLTAVPVVIRGEVDVNVATEVMLVENCHRADLNPVEKARAFAKLRDHGYTQTKIAERTGLSAQTISHFLALMDLDDATQELVRTGQLGVGDALAAVRRTRAASKWKSGGRPSERSWEPDYLSASHRLAKKARARCDARDHGMRRRVGKTACGQCWEIVIREDATGVPA